MARQALSFSPLSERTIALNGAREAKTIRAESYIACPVQNRFRRDHEPFLRKILQGTLGPSSLSPLNRDQAPPARSGRPMRLLRVWHSNAELIVFHRPREATRVKMPIVAVARCNDPSASLTTQRLPEASGNSARQFAGRNANMGGGMGPSIT
ncbi:hypothetical protein DFP72DRAFT_201575 [Ephemerocybe angulata]|uniref:Uncharacterized protein n=1 Tax=Ephemerocybe angulata TaxID=980116 RepID=A0A8H6IH16_9AGAR|nr:hypothetical protein DFP72DRAFT_201575 [Tulosesus angulatus]